MLKIILRLRGRVLYTSENIFEENTIRIRRLRNFVHRALIKMKILSYRPFLQRSMVFVKFLVVSVNVVLYPPILWTCNGKLKVGNLCIHDVALSSSVLAASFPAHLSHGWRTPCFTLRPQSSTMNESLMTLAAGFQSWKLFLHFTHHL